MPRAKPGKPDRRELPGRASVKKVTARPKGIKPEEKEPKRKHDNSIVGNPGGRKRK